MCENNINNKPNTEEQAAEEIIKDKNLDERSLEDLKDLARKLNKSVINKDK